MNVDDNMIFYIKSYEELEGYDLRESYVMIGAKCLLREILHDKENV